VNEHQAELLEFVEHRFGALPFCGDLDRAKQIAGFTFKSTVGIVEKFIIAKWTDSAQEQRLNVDRAKARGPSKALEPQSDMLRIGELAAAIARQ